MFEMQTQVEILARMQSDLTTLLNGQSSIEGSFNFDMLSANSVEFQNAYAEMNLIIQAGFAQSAWGDYLTMRAEEFGVIRKMATAATGTVNVTGTPGSEILKGSLFSTALNITFATITDAFLDGSGNVTVKVQATVPGSAGNTGAGTITSIPMSIPGVTGVTNPTPCTGGYETESDTELLGRYLEKVRQPATSGNVYHYLQWAQSVPGVGQVKIIPLAGGPGTVEVIILDENSQTAGQQLIQNVVDYLAQNQPIGATVTVISPQPLPINISATIVGAFDVTALTSAINAYFTANVFNMTDVSIAQIGRLLLETGTITDYSNLTINGGTGNISISNSQLPVCGSVNLHVAS